jgi:hypothetical protein
MLFGTHDLDAEIDVADFLRQETAIDCVPHLTTSAEKLDLTIDVTRVARPAGPSRRI